MGLDSSEMYEGECDVSEPANVCDMSMKRMLILLFHLLHHLFQLYQVSVIVVLNIL